MRVFINLMKCMLAGIVAIAILCFLLTPYFSIPVHVANPHGNTDYVWPAGSWWSKMTEGISFGKYDAKGFNNKEVIANPDILVLGSSHTEAVDVLQSENFTALLREKFRGEYTAYNMGISGHFFLKVCKYLPETSALYPDAKYIVIETSKVDFDRKEVDSLLNGTVEFTPSNDSGLIGTLQKFPFFRMVYHQLTGGLLDMLLPEKDQSVEKSQSASAPVLPDEAVYDDLFANIQERLGESAAQVIIMYHPSGVFSEDGAVAFVNDEPALAMFSQKCGEYGFSFVDMTKAFTEMYETEHKLPHGFVTGKIGYGHLNKYGHAKIADELAKCITALREGE